MGNVHLVTGYAGRSHVAAADMASLFEALIRNGQFVMAAGSGFEAAVVTNNQVRISDGELLMQGRHVKLDPGAYVDMVIENGQQGFLRHDLIVARYSRNTETGIEDCNLIVIKGTPAESDPADPDYISGNINAEGATENDMPLYRVVLSGLNIERLDVLSESQPPLYDTFLPRSGGTMTGPLILSYNNLTGFSALNGVRMGGFRFDKNTTCALPIGENRWAALVAVTLNTGDCALYFLAGRNGNEIKYSFKLSGTDACTIGFTASSNILTVTCNTGWSAGWYIATSYYHDLPAG